MEEKEGKRELDVMRNWIDNKTALTFYLVKGKALNGILKWRDAYNLGLKLSNGKEVFIFKHAVLYIEPI